MSETVNGNSFDKCRPVTIVTDELMVFQGKIINHRDNCKHEPDICCEPPFLKLDLDCTPALLVPAGTGVCAKPLYNVYPTLCPVKINIHQIITISNFVYCVASGSAPAGV